MLLPVMNTKKQKTKTWTYKKFLQLNAAEIYLEYSYWMKKKIVKLYETAKSSYSFCCEGFLFCYPLFPNLKHYIKTQND